MVRATRSRSKDSAGAEDSSPKRTKPTEEEPETKQKVSEEEEEEEEEEYQVHITSSKACQAFKRTVDKLKTEIKKEIPDAVIVVDEQKKLASKPDKGSFIVKAKGKNGEEKTLVSLVAIPRPFTAMKEMSMEEVGKQVVDVLK